MNWRARTAILVSMTVFAGLLTGCGDAAAPPPERIRAVKTIVVAERASGQMRKFAGTIEPVDTSTLSFEVSGLIQTINVNAGDSVKHGDVLAVMDTQQFQLNLESARASSSRARAQLQEKSAAYERQRSIQQQDAGATSEKAVDQARAAYESARQNVSYSQAQFDLAKRDLEKTELRAPFDGVIADRRVEPFEEVTRGQPVLELFVEGAMQVVVGIPENMISGVYAGLPGEVHFPNRPDQAYQAVVSEVGSTASSANAFPIKANLREADDIVKPGMTAELTLLFASEETETAYLVPIQALVPGQSDDDRVVYVFDAGSTTVRKTIVTGKGLVGNQFMVTGGIGPGDIVVVAGVSFLTDGQKVKLLNPAPAGS